MTPHIFLLTALAATMALSAEAATFTVNSNENLLDVAPGDGVCDNSLTTAGSQCSIRAAIHEANANPDPDTILVPPRGPGLAWEHKGSQPWCVGSPVTISGISALPARIQGVATFAVPMVNLFDVDDSCSTLSLSDFEVTLRDLDIRQVSASEDVYRAGVYARFGTTRLENVSISNFERGGTGALALTQDATVVVSRSRIASNQVTGIYSSGTISVFDSEISGNDDTGGAGGIHVAGSPHNPGIARIMRSAITHNLGRWFGAGILAQVNTKLFVYNSTIAYNLSLLDGAGVYLEGAQFSADHPAEAFISNTTIVGNRIDYPQMVVGGDGGGISMNPSSQYDSTLHISNSILSGNKIGSVETGTDSDCDGTINSNGYNLVETTTGCIVVETSHPGTDLLNLSPALQPFANHGGLTKTFALDYSSIARDGGDPAGCFGDHDLDPNTPDAQLLTDQRGLGLPRNARCDIGAYEYFDCASEIADLTLSDLNVNSPRLEQACGSLTLEGVSVVGPGGDLFLNSPRTLLGTGFRVASGGTLSIGTTIE